MSLFEPSLQLKPYMEKPVAVLGYGVSGQAVISLLEKQNVQWIAYDEREGEELRREFTATQAEEHDLVIFSPGFQMSHPWLQVAKENACQIMGEIEFAAYFWNGESILVTGTNGKTTICDFLTYALKRVGKDAVSAGNMGFPLSKIAIEPRYEGINVVCEVSSFQAESLKTLRACALIWTNFNEDHLDRYSNLEEYFAAKWRLLGLLQKPLFICDHSVAKAARRFGYELPEFTQIIDSDSSQYWEMPIESAFHAKKQAHNLLMVRAFWENWGLDPDQLKSAAESFGPREHRLRFVGKVGNVSFWNDSKATNFSAALAALENFDDKVFWIGGGKDRGGDMKRFAEQMAPHIEEAFLVGEVAPVLSAYLDDFAVRSDILQDLQEAVNKAIEHATEKSHVVFSPGFSSQDYFSSFVERGVCFENAVKGLIKTQGITK